MIQGYIYIIFNDVNDKVYIGKTTGFIEKRWKGHISAMNSALRGKRNLTKIYKAMSEIGVEHFHIEKIFEFVCESNIRLNSEEGKYIQILDTINSGYNERDSGYYFPQ